MKSIIVLLLPTLLLLQACGGGASEAGALTAETDPGLPVKAATIVREQVRVAVHASGTVSTANDARPAFKTGGVIARILVDEGDAIREGQLLATLHLTEINAQVQQATEGVDKARRDLQRVKNLYADSVATLEQLQDATTGLSIAEQNLRMATFNQSYSEIRAPFSGKVVKRLMNEGEVAGPGMPVFYLLSNARQDWVVRVGLSDRDWARLSVGDRADIRLDAYPGQTFTGRVSKLADVGNPQSGTFDVEFAFVGALPRLAVGLMATVDAYPSDQREYAIIPIDALVESNGDSAIVYTLDRNATAHRVAVALGRLFQDKAVVLSGLDDSARVVTVGAPYLEDGRKVRVIE